jgi:signal transduction histidine kinase
MAVNDEGPRPTAGLSTRILALAVAFLLLGEVLIFVPSIARFRVDYLDTMIAQAHLACLAKVGREGPLDPALEATLLEHVRATAVRLWMEGVEPGTSLGRAAEVDRVYDVRDRTPVMLVRDALVTLVRREPRTIRVIGASPVDPTMLVDVVFEERLLRGEMMAYAWRILLLSLALSAIMAGLLLLALRRMIVRPLGEVAARLMAFRERPEDATLDPLPSRRHDEIGLVEREMAAMQRRVRQALQQRTRLAALGAAVSQISHDLKNILSAAVLISDRLETSADPAVRSLAGRLMQTLERAIRLCNDTLRFARDEPPAPRLGRFALGPLVDEVAATVTSDAPQLVVESRLTPGLELAADRDQLYRVLLNLVRNAREAIGERPGRIGVVAEAREGEVELRVVDDGPGVPAAVEPRLFESFGGTSKDGGSGLGLAICREIVRAHGGEIELTETGPEGTVFTIRLPERVGRAAA